MAERLRPILAHGEAVRALLGFFQSTLDDRVEALHKNAVAALTDEPAKAQALRLQGQTTLLTSWIRDVEAIVKDLRRKA